MASSLKERKKTASKKAASQQGNRNKEETEDREPEVITFETILWILLVLVLIAGSIMIYKADLKRNGPFAAWVNKNLLPKNRYQKAF